jgi:zinicin-like metallopeptidase
VPPARKRYPSAGASPRAGSAAIPRTGPARDRHGRGPRGPLVLPGAYLDVETPVPTPRDRFDDLVGSLVDRHLRRWPEELAEVQFATEDVPDIPTEWGHEPVPLGALVRARADQPARIVVFRRPVELRARSRTDQIALVNDVLVEHIADLLGREPTDIDPSGVDGDL